jgi:1-acyl-sn-glycerol-3-phosphate acyltransferase
VWLYSRPQVRGVEHLPQEGAWLLVANHASHVDTGVLYAAVPRRLRRRLLAAAAQDYFFTGGLRQTMVRTLFNGIPVDRDGQSGRDPLRHVIRALREGYGVLLFPEGTRSTTGKIGRFRSGVGRLIATFPEVPVIPAYLEGTADMMPKGRPLPVPGSVKVTFGPPLFLTADPESISTWRHAAEQVREAVVALSLPPPPPVETEDERAKDEGLGAKDQEVRAEDRAVEPPVLDAGTQDPALQDALDRHNEEVTDARRLQRISQRALRALRSIRLPWRKHDRDR